MPTLAISAPVPTGLNCYLDTSAVIPLVFARAARRGDPIAASKAVELSRATKVSGFAQHVAAAGGRLVATVLGLEELAATARNAGLQQEARKAGFPNWKALRGKPAERRVLRKVQTEVLSVLADAVDEMRQLGVVLDRPVASSPTPASAEAQQRQHRTLLQKYSSLDAMDALHIVIAAEMGISSFVTFDRGWTTVHGIDIYR